MTIRRLISMLILIPSLVFICLMPTYLGNQVAKLNRQLRLAKRDVAALEAEHNRLEIVWNNVSRPESIARLTAHYLPAMKPPQQQQFVNHQWFVEHRLTIDANSKLALRDTAPYGTQLNP
ncbi:MAG: hypothetical protein ORN57_04870 [Alphaproteobacteria bacterium]|nr:hypothetical protein [Alphaproteobacteria bacterium]